MRTMTSLPARVILLALTAGPIVGFTIALYVLLTEGLSTLLFLGDPIATARTLPVWYLYAVPTLEITYDYNIIVPTAVIVVITGYLMDRLVHIEKLDADSVNTVVTSEQGSIR